MFNVAVLKVKDIIKYFAGGTIITLLIVTTITYFTNKKEEKKSEIQIIPTSLLQNDFINCLEATLPVVAEVNGTNAENQSQKKNNDDVYKDILKSQISSIQGVEETEKVANENSIDNTIDENNLNTNETENPTNNELVKTNLPTQVVTPNPIEESFNVQYGKVKIKNQTTFNLTEEMLKPDIMIDNRNVLIFHTHSCESYTPSNAYPYATTGNYRTTDLNYTVTRVGTELETQLKQYNFNVLHDTSYHDYPAYNGSYTRSLTTVQNILKTTQSDIIIDLHRDAIGSRSDYAPAVKIGDTDVAAQIMFVIGTNQGGLVHPNWNQNLKFAIKVQEKAEELYPRFI